MVAFCLFWILSFESITWHDLSSSGVTLSFVLMMSNCIGRMELLSVGRISAVGFSFLNRDSMRQWRHNPVSSQSLCDPYSLSRFHSRVLGGTVLV